MAKIVIKKRIALDFLGDEYKDSYLVFRSMPVSTFEQVIDKFENVSNKESLQLTIKILKDNFLEGKFLGEEVKVEDLAEFDIETLVSCLELFTGQKQSPKVEEN